ncbi:MULTISPECIES: hypothetical protein [Streptomyces]|uniref:hypothetical protein n=1 Tax=Streptomyces TaxID=1883 RepID=UPI000B04493B|nr:MULTISPECIES: hypothetical protein [Streptomyces]MDI5911427.1 hypothetical protein [Streptomyces sp. 12257]
MSAGRGGAAPLDPALPLRGVESRPEVLQPMRAEAMVEWDVAEGKLSVGLPRAGTAVLLRLAGPA